MGCRQEVAGNRGVGVGVAKFAGPTIRGPEVGRDPTIRGREVGRGGEPGRDPTIRGREVGRSGEAGREPTILGREVRRGGEVGPEPTIRGREVGRGGEVGPEPTIRGREVGRGGEVGREPAMVWSRSWPALRLSSGVAEKKAYGWFWLSSRSWPETGDGVGGGREVRREPMEWCKCRREVGEGCRSCEVFIVASRGGLGGSFGCGGVMLWGWVCK